MKQITFKKMDFEDDMRVFIPFILTTVSSILITESFIIVDSKAFSYNGPIEIITL